MICMFDLRRGHFCDAHESCRRMYKRGTYRLLASMHGDDRLWEYIYGNLIK